MSLIDEIRSGSKEAIKQVYQENAQDVYNFAKGITNDHDNAMLATKNTFGKLFKQIQAGEEPANIHSAALKLAYDEACKIAMPSVQNTKPEFEENEPAPAPASKVRQVSYEEEAPVRQRQASYEEAPARQRPVREETPARQRPVHEEAPARRYRDEEDEYDRPRRPQSRREDPRARRYQEPEYDDYEEYDDEYEDDYDDRPRHGAGFVICLIINIILVLLLVWFLIGLLINLNVLPNTLDFGYIWFDNHIYPLF